MSRIYVANLAAYNAGRLVGEWLDLEDYADAEELSAAVEALTGEDEFAIHDYEGFGGFSIGEYSPLDFVFRLHELVESHGAAFAVFAENIWTNRIDTADDLDDAESAFIDAWIGNISAEDYAYDYVTDCLGLEGIALDYFDFAKFARDLIIGGDISEHYEDGEIYLFHNN